MKYIINTFMFIFNSTIIRALDCKLIKYIYMYVCINNKKIRTTKQTNATTNKYIIYIKSGYINLNSTSGPQSCRNLEIEYFLEKTFLRRIQLE